MSLAQQSPEDTLFSDGRSTIAGNIRALMGRHRISQKRVATEMGVSQAYVSRRLSGEVPLDTDELLFFARFFEVEITDLLAGTRSRCFGGLGLASTPVGQMELAFGERPDLALV